MAFIRGKLGAGRPRLRVRAVVAAPHLCKLAVCESGNDNDDGNCRNYASLPAGCRNPFRMFRTPGPRDGHRQGCDGRYHPRSCGRFGRWHNAINGQHAVGHHCLAHMDQAGADSLKTLLPRHQQVVEALIKDCENMMRMEKMSPPRKWTNTVADVRQDLARMMTMSSAGVAQAWPDHERRIRDMLNMRHDMMKSMKM